MLLLSGRVINGLKADGYRNFGAGVRGAIQAERAAKLARSLLHDRDAEMSDPFCIIGELEAVPIIADG